MILSLYLSAMIVSYSLLGFIEASMFHSIKKDGYKFTKKDKEGNKTKIDGIFKDNKDFIITPFIPVFNFLFPFYLLSKKDLLIHKTKQRLIREEKVTKPKEEAIINESKKSEDTHKEVVKVPTTVNKQKVLKKTMKKN